MLTEQFIQQTYLKHMNLFLHQDEWQADISNDLQDYMNTDIVFHSQRLLPVMQFMLDQIPGNRQLRARCQLSERILTLWILGLDALATASGNTRLLPRSSPESSGRVDCLLPGDPSALLDLSDADFIQLTAQGERHTDDVIPREQLAQTMQHWSRFESWLSRALAQTGEHCVAQLAALQRHCDVDERVVRRFDTDFGFITVNLGPVNPESVSATDPVEFVKRVCRREIHPVALESRIHYHNGAIIGRFSVQKDVANVNQLTAADYGDVVRQAIGWLRDERRRLKLDSYSPAPALRLVA
ncbi:hypothetical protein F9U39_21340 [Pectobacterium versatile]|uniref:Uncharacterized protein n=2 Tax=Pectobacterium TaxID=122277 RepID=A0AAW3SSN0_9GAMM|nr:MULTISPECIES: hypothetical protein [Pectobacterium]MBA5204724.1 hypothetical protein [Pectobacterium aroidearum]MBN3176416.1 hypothetical protein [Pectobacterium parmentieri]MBQ4791971.1 hypothetical protein [Pectobacterium versatile]QHQ23393.1 hypothetical protein GMX10_04365 [Pectobacterium parvum]QRN28913.1 hypothetical protein IG623_16490 [Pectobacterium parmentieri]